MPERVRVRLCAQKHFSLKIRWGDNVVSVGSFNFILFSNQHTDAPTYFFFLPPFSFFGFSTTGGPMSRVFRYQLRISLSISA